LQAHLKATHADAQPKLLKELANRYYPDIQIRNILPRTKK
jgi:hypothetical protein